MGRPNWQGANNQILNRLVRTRFTPANYNQDEACSVCLEEFKADDEVITLPCNARHIFHSHCIVEWLTRNNVCPLCKQPIEGKSFLMIVQPRVFRTKSGTRDSNN